ncbi:MULTISPECIES: tyrosine--tRNA ligase [unclassified Streptomyces]|uniref:tyrosine--tRNA ligase n=1 Tax=unclassified Streptomyces TaxID=2593676 RepID=UPI002DDA61BB|nr:MULTISPECIES: tyrosine--tRNA ligase [unclassified Streptomyces]WSA95689.1 tyrosine--tRNA ligase [Streptomyces sp. NBC_01795]WSB80109.1 tyrosine--tRNA ligase [Streptomyces sp. NBC_01775]WSS11684.1 tyrosine--tRNA ligase [Streptomyces sp. NBC_01186]WSS40397.1 tyrosine--tRNA ligase [Streptomyces sp. NBC_01187]
MTRLGDSVQRASELLAQDLSSDQTVERLLAETGSRRYLDLSDLPAKEQAALIGARTVELLPSVEKLAERIEERAAQGRGLHIKLGIDPTAADVHLGHAVPVIVLSRFQRMGHDVTLIIGDFTAKIGDPSGRTAERPPLTDEDIAENLSGYREQVRPFFDFEKVRFVHNSEWLGSFTLSRLLGLLSQVPVSSLLQRDDFRNRLSEGSGLTMSELLYPIAQAVDSAELRCDVELGGVDQLLNLQMGRRVMEAYGQQPQLVVTMPLVEGTDGSGAKMSKSKGNYVGLGSAPGEVFGKIMSIPDRLMAPYLRAWTEWTDPEIERATARIEAGSLHPMDLKKILAGEVVAALHGVASAMEARAGFVAQFSKKSFADVGSLPSVDVAEHGEEGIAAVMTNVLEFTPSASAARRIAKQNGLRLIVERAGAEQEAVVLPEADALRPLAEVVREKVTGSAGDAADAVYLKAGRKVAEIRGL